ncbi:PREDICTED: uncharacterized protein LOC105458997 isoform X2 [Wasmannia auropunctata]|uniref:uncharacterized protein LOC105458997 isoform X2 n=1 Tax=Wasmannia auropunctata TaxID=64793 RepID=UPI0005F0B596|nr:PREDICTED: uncharacterized protein LOC105458997 isoform X2 [Wasmannia auropunctata]
MKRLNSPKILKPTDVKNSNMRIGETMRFTFKNGDSYEGKYQVNIDRRTLVKQDQGVYITDNFDVYDGKWYNDKFGSDEFHIRYNNNARYKGYVDANGVMNGTGTYIFPDESTLSSVWSQNKPILNIVYKKPLGYEWTTTSISDSHVMFTTVNQFWNEIHEESAKENFPSVRH